MTRDDLLKLVEEAGAEWPDDFTTEQGADLIQAGVRFNRIGPKIIPELLRRLDLAEQALAAFCDPGGSDWVGNFIARADALGPARGALAVIRRPLDTDETTGLT